MTDLTGLTDSDLLRVIAAELTVLQQDDEANGATFTIELGPLVAFQLVALVQNTLKHPNLDPGTRGAGEAVVATITEMFADCPGISLVIQRGADPTNRAHEPRIIIAH